jgi:A/G-specific adenine glycosylase
MPPGVPVALRDKQIADRHDDGAGGATGAGPAGRPSLVRDLLRWYSAHQRDLPWRAPDRTPWGVLVSEVMLAQTPVARVVPYWSAWMARWPEPSRLARDHPAEAVRQWGRLGYPRRALSLHAAATCCLQRYGGQVPSGYDDLRSLPGVGDYTAAAVTAFGFGARAVVLDTNVRRVLARAFDARAQAPRTITRAERERADALLPAQPALAAAFSQAVMELGALVCTARAPACPACPLAGSCRWLAAGRPAPEGPAPRSQRYAGTDRQVRGLLLAVLRDAPGPVPGRRLDAVWPEAGQRARALDSLIADGLVVPLARRRYELPRLGSRHIVSTAGPPPGSTNRSRRTNPTDS